jgi:Uma2 family endonuclease
LILLFGQPLTRFRLALLPVLRVQIEPDLFRSSIAIEIGSPDDRYNDLMPRLEDYRRWGVPNVWLVDPFLKRRYEYTDAGVLQHPSFRLPEFDFKITSQELFKDV